MNPRSARAALALFVAVALSLWTCSAALAVEVSTWDEVWEDGQRRVSKALRQKRCQKAFSDVYPGFDPLEAWNDRGLKVTFWSGPVTGSSVLLGATNCAWGPRVLVNTTFLGAAGGRQLARTLVHEIAHLAGCWDGKDYSRAQSEAFSQQIAEQCFPEETYPYFGRADAAAP